MTVMINSKKCITPLSRRTITKILFQTRSETSSKLEKVHYKHSTQKYPPGLLHLEDIFISNYVLFYLVSLIWAPLILFFLIPYRG